MLLTCNLIDSQAFSQAHYLESSSVSSKHIHQIGGSYEQTAKEHSLPRTLFFSTSCVIFCPEIETRYRTLWFWMDRFCFALWVLITNCHLADDEWNMYRRHWGWAVIIFWQSKLVRRSSSFSEQQVAKMTLDVISWLWLLKINLEGSTVHESMFKAW
jgi:hypothetical protein